MEKLQLRFDNLLRASEKYFKTDMVYLVRGSFWMNANNAITTALAFILYVAFSHLMPKEQYGTYQFILSISSILGAITLSGMNSAITQAVARGFEGSFKESVTTQLKWGIIPFLTGLILGGYYFIHDNHTLGYSVMVIALLLPILNSFNTYSAFMSGKKDFRRAFFYAQILNFSYYPIIIISLYFTSNPLYLIILNFGSNTIVAAILYFLTIRFYKPNTQTDPTTISYGKHLSLANIIGTFVLQIDNIFVFHFTGAISLAVYVFATNIPDRFNSLIKTITTAALPKFSLYSRDDMQKNIISKSIRYALLTLIASLIYCGLAPFVYQIFFPQYMSAVPYSQLYALMLVIVALSGLPLTALVAIKAKEELYMYNIIFPFISAGATLVGITMFGIKGIILAKGISGIFSFLLLSILIFRRKFVKEV